MFPMRQIMGLIANSLLKYRTTDMEIQHRDKIGRLIKVGDCVAYPINNSLYVGTVQKLNPKMIRVSKIGKKKSYSTEKNRYPQDVVLLEGPEVTMYLIKNSDI